ncbi:hypothetical protein D9X91_15520 [Falsibacillus albus]|uniref:Uncharacterized protein n=1 Tax=Falsibacillus albus TaxID=2478915 RepID=A0A3L7K067_9BACI|nr:hypothetical protein D9X91_15520 [Falsibacillus albus]
MMSHFKEKLLKTTIFEKRAFSKEFPSPFVLFSSLSLSHPFISICKKRIIITKLQHLTAEEGGIFVEYFWMKVDVYNFVHKNTKRKH